MMDHLPWSFKSSHNPSEQLRRLDVSSPKFRDHVRKMFYGEEYKRWMLGVQGDDLLGLVEYLDKVCFYFSFTRPPLMPL